MVFFVHAKTECICPKHLTSIFPTSVQVPAGEGSLPCVIRLPDMGTGGLAALMRPFMRPVKLGAKNISSAGVDASMVIHLLLRDHANAVMSEDWTRFDRGFQDVCVFLASAAEEICLVFDGMRPMGKCASEKRTLSRATAAAEASDLEHRLEDMARAEQTEEGEAGEAVSEASAALPGAIGWPT